MLRCFDLERNFDALSGLKCSQVFTKRVKYCRLASISFVLNALVSRYERYLDMTWWGDGWSFLIVPVRGRGIEEVGSSSLLSSTIIPVLCLSVLIRHH